MVIVTKDEARELVLNCVEVLDCVNMGSLEDIGTDLKQLRSLLKCLDSGEMDEHIYELAESQVDIYTSDLLDWIRNDLNNVFYVDDAIKETGGSLEFIQLMMYGQNIYNKELLNDALDKLKEEVKDLIYELE